MTEKQIQIIEAALELFANEGYNATSTSKVAKKAKVSEGLIFRHFKNKQGLVDAILNEGISRLHHLFIPILLEEDPKQVIKKTLEMPFTVKGEALLFWKLQFKLKWELEYFNHEKMNPLESVLINAFSKLHYKEPKLETDLIINLLDGIATAIIGEHIKNEQKYKTFLYKKYHIEQ